MNWTVLAQATENSAGLEIDWNAVLVNATANGLRILIILALIAVGLWLLRRILRQLGLKDSGLDLAKADDQQRRRSTLLKLTYTFASIGIWLVGGLTVLSLLGINVAPLLAGAGIAGIALGFGAQSLVQDILGGVFILLDEKVRVGDVLKVNDVSGVVERLDLRTLTLRDFSGDAHIINWGRIDRLSNLTLQWSRVLLDVGASYNDEPDRVIAVLQDTATTLAADPEWADYFLEQPTVLGIVDFADSAMVYRLTAQVRASYQWSLGREFRRRIWYAFRDAGLSFPYPQVTQSFARETPLQVEVVGDVSAVRRPPSAESGASIPLDAQ